MSNYAYTFTAIVSYILHSANLALIICLREIVNEWSRDQREVNRPSSQLSGSSQSNARLSDREVARILADLAAFGTDYVKVVEDTPILSAAEM